MTPLQRYQADLARGGFRADPDQQRVVLELQVLYDALQERAQPRPLWRRLVRRQRAAPRGLYLWGGPGRGKTYLMDCFFDSLPGDDKRRVHFHRFMIEIHEALRVLPKTPDPLPIVARQLAARHGVLCLDEFHVTDVADAMLLAGLLDGLLRQGVVVVATSNIPPDDLYRDGLQRARFLPAIALLHAHTAVVELAGSCDHRLERLELSGTYRVLEAPQAEQWLRSRMQELVTSPQQLSTGLEIAGRTLAACALAEDVVWFEFGELCERPRSSRDYLELAREFHTLLLQGLPLMGDEMDEAVRRFIHLVDALYDHGVKLIVTAAAAPDRLYTGTRLRQAFRRTASRLTEMSAKVYLARPHRAD
ncbi:MAG: cell division protein ZapE [Thiogranum sp.]|jgi:cell division protein ZapE